MSKSSLSFAFPADCVMLTNAAGKVTSYGLEIECILNTSPGRKITVNGALCTSSTNEYRAKVVLQSCDLSKLI